MNDYDLDLDDDLDIIDPDRHEDPDDDEWPGRDMELLSPTFLFTTKDTYQPKRRHHRFT